MTTTVADARISGVMDRLKLATADHHARAEGKDLQRALVRGQVSRERFAAFLAQMLVVHRALERAIDAAAAREPRVRVIPPEQRHSVRIEQDLRFFGLDAGTVRAMPATETLAHTIAAKTAASPMAVLGLHYVLEGSMNGNRYIAMALRKGLGLAPGEGDRYLDPYGEQQRAKWLAFRSAVDALAWSEFEVAAAIDAARAMFDGIAAISDSV